MLTLRFPCRRRARRVALCGLSLLAVSLASSAVTPADAGPGARSARRRQPLVRTSDGPVRGFVKSGANTFLGIPYAAPPVGRLRWRPPRAPTPVAQAARRHRLRPDLRAGHDARRVRGSDEHQRGLPVSERLHDARGPRHAAHRRPAGPRLDPRRRQRRRRIRRLRRQQARQRRALRRQGHRRRHRQLSPRPARLPGAPGARQRGPSVRQLRNHGHPGGAALGPAQHRAPSAATPTTSPSAASPPARPRPAPT